MDILKSQLDLGLVQPIRILQVSDCHLSGCCEEDSEKAKAKSKKKTAEFLKETGGVTQEQRLKEALDLSAEYDALVFTGDTNDCEGLSDFAKDADLLLADAAFLEEEWAEAKPHMSALRAARLAKEVTMPIDCHTLRNPWLNCEPRCLT